MFPNQFFYGGEHARNTKESLLMLLTMYVSREILMYMFL